MKKINLIGILAMIFIVGCQPAILTGITGTSETGRLVLGITDDVELGSISSLNIKISNIILHNVDGTKINIIVNKEFDLIELNQKNIVSELGDIQVPEGTYNLLVLSITSVEGIIDEKTEAITLPSNSLRIPVNIIVDTNKTSAVVLDFIADKSLHRTGEGKIIMTPVIQLTTRRNVEVTKDVEGLRFGQAVSEEVKQIGTDIRGVVGENKRVTKEDIDRIVVDRVGRIREIPRP